MRTSQSSQSEDRSLKQNKNPPQPKLDYRSMVSIDDMPALFVSFDSKYWILLFLNFLFFLEKFFAPKLLLVCVNHYIFT